MGMFDGWKRKQQVKEAAKQLWAFLQRGYNIEVPLLLDKNDLTMEAVTELQRRHPQAQLRMYQSRGMVLGLFRNESQRGNRGISDAVLDQFNSAGHIGGGYTEMQPEDMLAAQEAFLRSQGFNPEQQEKEAQEERARRDRIEVGSANIVEQAVQALKEADSAVRAPGAVALAADGTLPAEPSADGAAK